MDILIRSKDVVPTLLIVIYRRKQMPCASAYDGSNTPSAAPDLDDFVSDIMKLSYQLIEKISPEI